MSFDDKLTCRYLRHRLSNTRLPENPTEVILPASSERWPADMVEALTTSLKPAGVLIPIIERGSDSTVLLTRRSAELKHHASQIAFPGGRMEDHDADIRATALRETHEEVGIAPADVAVLGYLEPMPTVTGYAVTATVGAIPGNVELVIDASEVEFAFEVPLEFVLDSRNATTSEREFRGRKLPIVEFNYDGHRIWGATANLLLQLIKKIN